MMEMHPIHEYLHKLDVLLQGTMPEEQVKQCLEEVEDHLIESGKAIQEVYPHVQDPWQAAVDRFGKAKKVANALRMGFLSHRDRVSYYLTVTTEPIIMLFTWIIMWILPLKYSLHFSASALCSIYLIFVFKQQIRFLRKGVFSGDFMVKQALKIRLLSIFPLLIVMILLATLVNYYDQKFIVKTLTFNIFFHHNPNTMGIFLMDSLFFFLSITIIIALWRKNRKAQAIQ